MPIQIERFPPFDSLIFNRTQDWVTLVAVYAWAMTIFVMWMAAY
jgi:hypothetical protein